MFYGVILVFVIIYILKKKRATPPSTRSAPPQSAPSQAPPPQASAPGPEREVTVDDFLRFAEKNPEQARSVVDMLNSRAGGESVRSDFGGSIKGVFVMVTSGEPQTQMVAMSLSTQVLIKGKSVRVLLCGPGGDMALRNSSGVILKPLDKSPQMLLQGLIQKRVPVEICPFYLANRAESEADLIDGITPAKPAAVADELLEPGIKLFTF
ncbi:MAG: hypothetical protein B6245_10665 [Desulfobacteraceae bacterium 4572_88]|nr:MAG: hypothetical protein B6245_10665 [Desulfobacteraceae bacterium 4572_88]